MGEIGGGNWGQILIFLDVGKALGGQGYREQVSFKNGVEVPYGTKGSTRPDYYGKDSSVEVKNYNVETLYGGELQQGDAATALAELEQAKRELAELPPSKVIWDIENRGKEPPWGANISADITDLSNYFVTSTGRDLFNVLKEALEELRDRGGVLKVVSRGCLNFRVRGAERLVHGGGRRLRRTDRRGGQVGRAS